MAYKFNPYRSVYRDPQSVKVSEVLRDRYVKNFASDSMLDKALNEMLVAAEFAGDVEKAEELKQKLHNNSAARVERGDFENLGMAINMDVRDFSRQYEPIKQNYEAREKDKEAKLKLVEAGRITNEQYNQWEKRSLMRTNEETGDYEGYTGLQYKEDGSLDRSSIYNPTTIAHNVNVDKEILAALQTIEGEKSGGYVTKVPRTVRIDTNGDGIIDSSDGAYEFIVRTESGETYKVDEDKVRAVTNEVLNRGDVRAYMEQDADFSTFDMLEEDLDAILGARKAALEAKVNRGDLSPNERAEAVSAISSLERAMGGGVGLKRATAKAAKLDAEKERLTRMGIEAKAVNYTVGGGYEMDYSARQKENWRRTTTGNGIPPQPTMPPSITGGGEVITSDLRNQIDPNTGETIEGVTTESLSNYLTAQQELADLAGQEILDNYSFLLGEEVDGVFTYTGGVEGAVDYLDTTSMEQIRARLNEVAAANGNVIPLADGTSVSVQAALEQIEQEKQNVEHYRRVEEANALMVEYANNESSANAEDVTGYTSYDEFISEATSPDNVVGAVTHAGLLTEKLLKEFGYTQENNQIGDVAKYVHTVMGGAVSLEDVQAELDAIIAHHNNEDSSASLYYDRLGSAVTEGQKRYSRRLMDEIMSNLEQRGQWFNENTQGNSSYPIFDIPAYASDDDWKKFTNLIINAGPELLLNRPSTAAGPDNSALTILDVLGVSSEKVNEIVGVQATFTTRGDGMPVPAFRVKFKVGVGDGNQTQDKVVVVPLESLGGEAQQIFGSFTAGTLDEEILRSAYQVHNTYQGVTKKDKFVTVPYNDGNLDLTIKFTATEQAAAEGAAPSFDLTSGYVFITGTGPNGEQFDNLRVTYTEYQRMMRDLGAKDGRAADLAYKQREAARAQGQQLPPV
mgnify:CR=1 FL=1|tara:strand:- start:17702 stop:20425 length:2724 start_codon:yes stop_codon:yes gene_type:complete